MVSCEVVNFVFLSVAYWRFSVTYLVSSRRFTNILLQLELNYGVLKLFIFDGIISFLNILFPILWGVLSIKIEDIDKSVFARQVARASILMIIVLMFISCGVIAYAFYKIRQFMILSSAGTMNIRIIVIHAVSFALWVASFSLNVLGSAESLRNKGNNHFSVKG